jgi:hypothetical protein
VPPHASVVDVVLLDVVLLDVVLLVVPVDEVVLMSDGTFTNEKSPCE